MPRSFSAWLNAVVDLPPVQWLYRVAFAGRSNWQLPVAPQRAQVASAAQRIGYYLWHFPVLSQTFVRRELSALREAGIDVHVFADGAEHVESIDADMQSWQDVTTYLDLSDASHRLRCHWRVARGHPWIYLRVLAFVLSHRYGPYKDLADDVAVFSRAVSLAGNLALHRITHVHAPWCDRAAFTAMLAASLMRIPYSVQARAHDIHRDTSLPGLRDRLVHAAFVVTNSEYNRRHIETLLDGGARKPPVVRIYNGIDLGRFPRVSAAPGGAGDIRLICVGRLIEQKGLIDLLHACRLLIDGGRRLRCTVIGAGEPDLYINYLLELRKTQRRLGLESAVSFLGARSFADVLAAYADADIFVLPCVLAADGSRDITPNALIEAMALEMAVISCPVTAIPEIVENGVSGVLVPPHNPTELAAAIVRLADDPDLRRRLGVAARQRIASRFDVHRNIGEYVRLFRA